jgi:hypothetical protein
VRPRDDHFDWGRLMPKDFDTDASLAAKLGGWHSLLRRIGRRVLARERNGPACGRVPSA